MALTGANDLPGIDRTAPDDGILTGVEIASLDLSQTSLVVLSACDTGGGTVQDGEGVLGLSRAFHAAGARTLVLSLWRVGDSAAQQWMTVFYAHLLNSESPARAIRAASRELLAQRRANGLSTDPAVWGAFVAVGHWR